MKAKLDSPPEAKDVAYTTVPVEDGFAVGVCVRHEQGWRPVYGPYEESRAVAIAKRLNADLGHDEREVALIIASTMRSTR